MAAGEERLDTSAEKRLAEATRLHETGLITDEEYQAKPAEIIADL